jgi:hypothetical protein
VAELVAFAWYDAVGTFGVALLLVAYFLLLSERITSRDLRYSVLNLCGAVLITVSLAYDFNLPAFIIEIFWMAVSVYGIWRALYPPQQDAHS